MVRDLHAHSGGSIGTRTPGLVFVARPGAPRRKTAREALGKRHPTGLAASLALVPIPSYPARR
jgi:hypothetical protein